jgi:NADH dehydrogenase
VAPVKSLDLVTGAFGNTGSRISSRLLAAGHQVRTLTSRPSTEGDVAAFDWSSVPEAFDGVTTFYNTFWMRTGNPGSGGTDYSQALERSTRLLEAASAAGVERIVHLSVARADDPQFAKYPYFAAKARVEALIRETGIAHTVVRPALIFGGGPGLVEQLAFVLRRVPVMGVAGDGKYVVRPVHVDDVADLVVAGGQSDVTSTVDAVGPDRPTFEELARAVAAALGKRRLFVHLPTSLVVTAGKLLGKLARQELLTEDELRSTMEGAADTEGPATGTISVLGWIAAQGRELGRSV